MLFPWPAARDIEIALKVLEPGGLLAFHDYPDPGWPDVRRIVDSYAARLGWKRIEQQDFLGFSGREKKVCFC